jgi:prefoldin subunit 5
MGTGIHFAKREPDKAALRARVAELEEQLETQQGLQGVLERAETAERERDAVLEGQRALQEQTVRIRKVLSSEVRDGADTEDIAREVVHARDEAIKTITRQSAYIEELKRECDEAKKALSDTERRRQDLFGILMSIHAAARISTDADGDGIVAAFAKLREECDEALAKLAASEEELIHLLRNTDWACSPAAIRRSIEKVIDEADKRSGTEKS